MSENVEKAKIEKFVRRSFGSSQRIPEQILKFSDFLHIRSGTFGRRHFCFPKTTQKSTSKNLKNRQKPAKNAIFSKKFKFQPNVRKTRFSENSFGDPLGKNRKIAENAESPKFDNSQKSPKIIKN